VISVISNSSSDPHLPHTKRPSGVAYTAVESHLIQAAVGSDASGRGFGGSIPLNLPPAIIVTGSNVAPHSAHTWLKQQFGVQL
jgi:hypothetical protein